MKILKSVSTLSANKLVVIVVELKWVKSLLVNCVYYLAKTISSNSWLVKLAK